MKLFNKNMINKTALLTLLIMFNGQLLAVENTSQANIAQTKTPVIDKNTLESLQVRQRQAKQSLMTKLAKISVFTAKFTQSLFDEEGETLQQGQGELSVSKPNLVYWHTQTPDESIIVADGHDLWFYDPFVEQVSVYDFANAIANTPILLISSNDKALWDKYTVIQISDKHYKIRAKMEDAKIELLEIIFKNEDSISISELILLDSTGQLSKFNLTEHQSAVDPAIFKFTVPEGVHIDDQR